MASEKELKYWIAVMGDDVVDAAAKMEAVEHLTAAGRDALPLLIERLLDAKDARFLVETPVALGPLQSAGPTKLTTTVRYMVETILYRILAPQRRPLEVKTKLDALKPKFDVPDPRPPIPWIGDWAAFWRTHKSHSLADIKAWSAEEVDKRWRAIDDKKAPTITPACMVPAEPVIVVAKEKDIAADRAAYLKARDVVADARMNAKKGSDVVKRAVGELAAIATANPRVKIHTDFMATTLTTMPPTSGSPSSSGSSGSTGSAGSRSSRSPVRR